MKKLLAILLLGCGHQVSYTLVPAHEVWNGYGQQVSRTYLVVARGDDVNKCRDTAMRAAMGVCARMQKAWYIVDTEEKQEPKEAIYSMEFGCLPKQ